MPKYVYDFHEGNKDQKDLLGGQGREPRRDDQPGPARPPWVHDQHRGLHATGCTTATEPEGLVDEIAEHLAGVEKAVGRELGQHDDPLLLSVRSGAKFSMPGMMDTVLNVGLNDKSVKGLVAHSGDPRFAWDSYRRLLQMFGKTVLGIDGDKFDHSSRRPRSAKGTTNDLGLDAKDLQGLVKTFKGVIVDETGMPFPQEPIEQLREAVRAVFRSWNTDRARLYRRQEKISDDLGTAVNVMAMVFGNLGDNSGTGVAFTRDPATGRRGSYGDYLSKAQGEDVVSGIRNTLSLDDLAEIDHEVARRAGRDHGQARGPLQGSVRHRVHRRARQAVDAADPDRQADGGRRLPDRRPAGRRGRHRHGRSADPGHR